LKQDGFYDAWKRQVLSGLAVSPRRRLAWLEEAMRFAAKVGALPQGPLVNKRGRKPAELYR